MVWEKAAEIIDLNTSRQKLAAGETAGVFLANARRAAGLSHANVADATKIKTRHLEAIEACDGAALPALPYAVGFVKVYAGFLGLDAEAIGARFKTDIAPPELQAIPVELPQAAGEGAGVRLVSMAAIVVIFMFVAWIAVQVAGGTDRGDATEAAAGPPMRVVGHAPTPTPRPQLVAEQTSLALEVASLPEPFAEKTPLPIAADGGGQTDAPMASGPAVFDSATRDLATADQPLMDLPISEPAMTEMPVDISLLEETPEIASHETQRAPLVEAPAPVHVSPFIIEPKLIRSKAPRYPARCARKATELETVTIFFDVTPDGRTANARAGVSSNACFNEAALRAIAKWRFEPETTNGVARLSTNRRATLNFQR